METKVVQNIRCLAADMVQKANSGHPGAPMGLAPIATILWGEFMNFDSKAAKWHNRDRFIMSNGHGCCLHYSLLHLSGYESMKLEDLKNFRQLHSKTPGHPERHLTEGIEVTTGPLGQGITNAVGVALAEAHLAATFNKPDFKIVSHKTYCIVGDGCLMEGVSQESLSLAGHLGLENLVIIYDDNLISIDGHTDIAFTEKHAQKYEALGIHTITVSDGNGDFDAMRRALEEANNTRGKPTMIILRTTIGKDSKMENTHKVHGSPMGDEDIAHLKTLYGRDPAAKFHIDQEAYDWFRKAAERGAAAHKQWDTTFAAYKDKYPELAAQYEAFWAKKMPAGWKDKLPRNAGKAIATRKASENALNEIMNAAAFVVGGSADLTGSNLTRPDGAKLTDFQKATPEGRYIRFGVREHAMCGVLNGIDAHGGLIAFGGTFLNFVSYAMGSVRLAALSRHGVIYVATHDSIGLGEDGPTHQPIETLAALRAMPNMLTLRPADQTETSAAWAVAIERTDGPTCLCLSRQNATPLEKSSFDGVFKGAYTVVECDSPKVVIVSSGTEVSTAVDAAKKVDGARVVSMPSWELFEKQPEQYRKSIFPEGVPVLSVEPYCAFGWQKYSHAHVGIDTFGESAPAEKIYEHFGITGDAVASKATKLVKHFEGKPVPALGHIKL